MNAQRLATSDAASIPRLQTLLLTDLVDSTRLTETLGDRRWSEVSTRHDRVARDLLARFNGREIDKTDGYLFLFDRPIDAVAYALEYHAALVALSAELGLAEALRSRAGALLGEVILRENSPEDIARGAKAIEIEGLAKPMAARIVALAMPGQTLLSREAFNLARRASVGADQLGEGVCWLDHGDYILKGLEDPTPICEVGRGGAAPLRPPPNSEKAKRAVRPGEEDIFGWRPAGGLSVPGREGWILDRKIGQGGFGEVWLAQHGRTRNLRTFKFCFEAERLRTLKRELTLFRLMKEVLGEREDIARLYDVRFDEAPFYLEMEYTEGGSLVEWSERQGGIGAVPVVTRLDLVAQVGAALAAAHSVGVIHKDVKPQNVLIHVNKDGSVQARLTDFGIGQLVASDVLKDAGVTATGFTTQPSVMTTDLGSRTGTRLYMAPELMAGRRPTIQSDVYALGVMFYQVVVADFNRPLGQGWERDVLGLASREDMESGASLGLMGRMGIVDAPASPEAASPAVGTGTTPTDFFDLLREDIAACVAGTPLDRLPTADLLSRRLRTLDQRLAEVRARRDAEAAARQRAALEARRRRMVRLTGTAAAVLGLLTIVAAVGYWRTEGERKRAEQERDKAERIAQFLEKMIQGVGPSVALGRDTTLLRELIDDAAKRIANGETRALPEVEVRLRRTIAHAYREIGAYDNAGETLKPAVEMAERTYKTDHAELAAMFEELGRLLEDRGEYEAALEKHMLALAIRQRLFKGDSADVATSLSCVASCLRALGRARDALSNNEAALAIRMRILQWGDHDLMTSVNNIALCIHQIGRVTDALPWYELSVDMRQRFLNAEEPGLALGLNSLAWCLRELGRVREAQPLNEAALRIWQRLFKDGHPNVAGALKATADSLEAVGRTDQALPMYEAALAMRRRAFKGDHPLTASCLSAIGLCMDRLGCADDALPKLEESLAMYQRVFKGDHPDVAASMNNVAMGLEWVNRPKNALPKYLASLEMWQRLYPTDHPDVSVGLNNIGMCLFRLGNFDEALQRFESSLEMNERLFKGDHPVVATTLCGVADCLFELGHAREARPKYEAALAMRQRLFGADQPDIATSLSKLARCHKALDHAADARPKYEEALAMRQRLFPGDNRDVASGLDNLASCLKDLGNARQALPMYEAALAMRQRIFNGDHNDVAISLTSLARCREALGNAREALPLYEAALAMHQRMFPGDHRDVATSLNNLAICRRDLGNAREALPMIETALAMRQRLFHGDHEDVAFSIYTQARCLENLGALNEALTHYDAALDMYMRLHQGDYPDVAGMLIASGYCLESLGRAREALPMYEFALEMNQRLFQDNHRAIADSLINVAYCLQALGRPAEALPRFKAALEMRVRVLPPGDAFIPKSQLGLGVLLIDLKKYDEAEALLSDTVGRLFAKGDGSTDLRQRGINGMVKLYEQWHAAEPKRGYDAKAAEWRAKLADFQPSTQPALPASP